MADEISWRRNWKPEFETEAWKVIHVDCKVYWIKYYFEESLCSYKIAVTDCEGIWIEDVDNEATFCERAKKLNPNIEAQSAYLIKHLSDCLTGLSGLTFSAREPGTGSDCFSLCLKSKLPAGIPFSWEFYCAPEQKQMMKDNLVLPLISMVGELQRRQKELFKILKRKDYEIQEYKNTGAVLPRSKRCD
ncbi:non-homologous end-joining factor 1-like [Dendronephthya gigantea]|uniref:non-homologous end-joining factor 1-like n=1 Tax=Dendronephthya gigantea TaxID=151771 RepID=UPI00106905EA|nr:non-homologous end-joining factor 1-like [Dendronephthya gigantea]